MNDQKAATTALYCSAKPRKGTASQEEMHCGTVQLLVSDSGMREHDAQTETETQRLKAFTSTSSKTQHKLEHQILNT